MVVFGRPFFLCQGCVLSVLFPRFGGQASGRRYGSSTSIIICSDLHAPLLGWSPMARGYASNSMSRELEIAFAGWSFCVWGRLLARPRKRRPRARSVLLLLLLLLAKGVAVFVYVPLCGCYALSLVVGRLRMGCSGVVRDRTAHTCGLDSFHQHRGVGTHQHLQTAGF